ncbi:hypothetical protein, partial [Sphaerimonospora thailandensis]|uniref:hypothetical protein n=1 Tax=Sphaerimonospora thailandensis TaxID=795644 RepID=UPI00194DD083
MELLRAGVSEELGRRGSGRGAAACCVWPDQRETFQFFAEPGQVGFAALAGEALSFEERIGLGQHQGVRPALSSGLVADRK